MAMTMLDLIETLTSIEKHIVDENYSLAEYHLDNVIIRLKNGQLHGTVVCSTGKGPIDMIMMAMDDKNYGIAKNRIGVIKTSYDKGAYGRILIPNKEANVNEDQTAKE